MLSGHGLSHAIENVETSLGIPKPDDLPGEPMKVTSDGSKTKDSEESQSEKEKVKKEDEPQSQENNGKYKSHNCCHLYST